MKFMLLTELMTCGFLVPRFSVQSRKVQLDVCWDLNVYTEIALKLACHALLVLSNTGDLFPFLS